jgi:hypothetical protein
LDIDADAAAAGQSRPPGDLIRDAEVEQPRRAVLDHIERRRDHLALDAAARDRAVKHARFVDDEMRADRPRRGAKSLDHGGDADAAPQPSPCLGLMQDLGFICQHPRVRSSC